jgi:hypothetical protein
MKKLLTIGMMGLAISAIASDFVIYPGGISTNSGPHGPSGCPGDYSGVATYSLTLAQGYGWAPDTNSPTITATYTNQSGVYVQILGKNGDTTCGTSSASVHVPPLSTKYRFGVYYPAGTTPPVGTNNAPLILHGFLP